MKTLDLGPRLFVLLLSIALMAAIIVVAWRGAGTIDPMVASVLGSFAAGLGMTVKDMVKGSGSKPNADGGSGSSSEAAAPSEPQPSSSALQMLAIPAGALAAGLLSSLLL